MAPTSWPDWTSCSSVDVGTEVAGEGGGRHFIHVAVAQEVLRRRHCGRLAFQHIQMVHDVEDAAREAVYILRVSQ